MSKNDKKYTHVKQTCLGVFILFTSNILKWFSFFSPTISNIEHPIEAFRFAGKQMRLF